MQLRPKHLHVVPSCGSGNAAAFRRDAGTSASSIPLPRHRYEGLSFWREPPRKSSGLERWSTYFRVLPEAGNVAWDMGSYEFLLSTRGKNPGKANVLIMQAKSAGRILCHGK